jgi:purine-nucleoside phosphorylase
MSIESIDAVTSRLNATFGAPPDVAIVLGSGLGAFTAQLGSPARAKYEEVGLPGTGVPGHAGEIVVGTLPAADGGTRRVACLSGRLHLYEGHPAAKAALGVRAMGRWGARGVILTSATGGVDPTLRVGELVLVCDHINLLGANPLQGPNLEALGPRFPDLARLYTRRLRALAREVAPRAVREGVYAAMPGPSYETPAEIRMLRALGAHVVGMSLVPEAIAAGHAGMEVLAVAIVTNPAAGMTEEELAHEDVTQATRLAADDVAGLLRAVVARW